MPKPRTGSIKAMEKHGGLGGLGRRWQRLTGVFRPCKQRSDRSKAVHVELVNVEINFNYCRINSVIIVESIQSNPMMRLLR